MMRPSFCLVLTSVLIIHRVQSSTAFLMQISSDRIILCLKSCILVFACISSVFTFLGSIIFKQQRKALFCIICMSSFVCSGNELTKMDP